MRSYYHGTWIVAAYGVRSFAEHKLREDLKSCFDPVISQIIALIEGQVKATEDNGHPRIQVCS